jgi:hypothetical protein
MSALFFVGARILVGKVFSSSASFSTSFSAFLLRCKFHLYCDVR